MDTGFYTSYLGLIETLHKNLREAVQDLPPEALDWVPGPEMNSIAVLIAHTTGSLRYWIGDIALGDPSGRVREEEFHTNGVSGEDLLRRVDAVIDYARASLPRLALADLERVYVFPGEDRSVSVGWALLHALEHAYLHLGHIQLTSQLWKAGGTSGQG